MVAVRVDDEEADAAWLAKKIAQLRVFEDEHGKMNRSVREAGGAILAISQFTLYGDCRKGNRPSFIQSADAEKGERLYERFVGELAKHNLPVQTGRFRADMQVEMVNDGPVTLIVDSHN